jgi:hypothetical protein
VLLGVRPVAEEQRSTFAVGGVHLGHVNEQQVTRPARWQLDGSAATRRRCGSSSLLPNLSASVRISCTQVGGCRATPETAVRQRGIVQEDHGGGQTQRIVAGVEPVRVVLVQRVTAAHVVA